MSEVIAKYRDFEVSRLKREMISNIRDRMNSLWSPQEVKKVTLDIQVKGSDPQNWFLKFETGESGIEPGELIRGLGLNMDPGLGEEAPVLKKSVLR